ncbi:MAG: putative glycolipid-binding domain-containing protein [Candidatus Dormiibacterota bacterium]
MSFRDLPANATWHHHGSREGFEAVFFSADETGYHLDGHTVATEGGHPWVVRYAITLNERWRTAAAQVWSWSHLGSRTVSLDAEKPGQWQVDGAVVPDLKGCIDIDLESSCCTNTFPVHRLRLGVGGSADTPAAYVRALDLSVQRLEQRYRRLDDASSRQRYEYQAPAFDFSALLIYDESGLLLEYPGIGSRVL